MSEIALFKHELFDTYAFEDIPLDRDVYLMGEEWMVEYERSIHAWKVEVAADIWNLGRIILEQLHGHNGAASDGGARDHKWVSVSPTL
jgi:hypothetical protein